MVWNSKCKIVINRPPLEIYTSFLAKPKEWPAWDTDLSKVDFEEEFKNLAKGKVYMKRMSSGINFYLQNLDAGRRMEYVTNLPGTSLVWYWDLKPNGDNTDLEMGVNCTGFLSGVYNLIMRKECDKAFVVCTKNLKDLAEKA